MEGFKVTLNFAQTDAELASHTSQRTLGNRIGRKAEKPFGISGGAPGGKTRGADRHGGPPSGEPGVKGKEEAGVPQVRIAFPKGLVEVEHSSENVADAKTADRLKDSGGFRLKPNGAVRENGQRYRDHSGPSGQFPIARLDDHTTLAPFDRFNNAVEADAYALGERERDPVVAVQNTKG